MVEIYSVNTNGEMRVTVSFLDDSGTEVRAQHFTATGQSGGWSGAVGGSAFTLRKAQLIIPLIRPASHRAGFRGIGCNDGRDADRRSFGARHPVPPTVLAGNFFRIPPLRKGHNWTIPGWRCRPAVGNGEAATLRLTR